MSLKRRLARVLPFTVVNEAIYPRSYFEGIDRDQRMLYERFADAIAERFAPASVVDVGCGTGRILARLAEHGIAVRGIDGSRSAIRGSLVPDRIMRWNLERPLPDIGQFDVAICTEVAEHLEPSSAGTLVSSLTRLSDTVVFTAATPGQGGRHHLNEQPHSYWEERFSQSGYARADEDEEFLQERIDDIDQAVWIRDNLMVYRARKNGGGSGGAA